nr:hypothetical protein [Actinopolymorpha singaporensis]
MDLYEYDRQDPRLGRNVEHDERSLAFAVGVLPRSAIKTVHWDRRIGILDQGNLGSCFPPETRVRLANGGECAIKDIRLLDEVLTAEGNIGRVTRTMVRDEEGGLVRVLLRGHAHLRLTREHPVLTARGYVPAGELCIGDEVALPKYLNGAVLSVPVEQFVTKPSHRLTRGNRWSGLPGRKGLKLDANALPEKITLDAPTGRLLGLFLAEGSCDASKARWTFAKHEADTLVAETAQLIKGVWGVEAHIAHRLNNSINVTLHGTGWSLLLSGLCGNGSGLKRPHDALMGGAKEFLTAMLDGWLDGDGHHRRDGSREGVTISRDLALAMYDIAQATGRHPVIDWRKSPQNSAAAVRQPRWTVTMPSGPGQCRETETQSGVRCGNCASRTTWGLSTTFPLKATSRMSPRASAFTTARETPPPDSSAPTPRRGRVW